MFDYFQIQFLQRDSFQHGSNYLFSDMDAVMRSFQALVNIHIFSTSGSEADLERGAMGVQPTPTGFCNQLFFVF